MPKALLPHTQRKWVRTLVRTGGGNRTPRFVRRARAPSIKSSQIADRRFAVLFRCPSGLAARRFARLPAARHAGRAQRAAPCADSRQGAPLRCCESAHTKGKATCIWPPFQEANEESRVFRFRRGFHNVSNCQLPPRLPRGAALSGIYPRLCHTRVFIGHVWLRAWSWGVGALPRLPTARASGAVGRWPGSSGRSQMSNLTVKTVKMCSRIYSKVRLARCVGQPERGMLVPARATNYPFDHPCEWGSACG